MVKILCKCCKLREALPEDTICPRCEDAREEARDTLKEMGASFPGDAPGMCQSDHWDVD